MSDMKFKVGDKVMVIVQRIDINGNPTCHSIGTIGFISAIDNYVNRPYKVVSNNDWWWYSEKELELVGSSKTKDKEEVINTKTYEDGLNDAWELVKKIYEMSSTDLSVIFDIEQPFGIPVYVCDVFDKYSIKETMDMLNKYEESKNKIHVGDIVMYEDVKRGAVVSIPRGITDCGYVIWEDGEATYLYSFSNCKKTGKHIDISEFLKSIKED